MELDSEWLAPGERGAIGCGAGCPVLPKLDEAAGRGPTGAEGSAALAMSGKGGAVFCRVKLDADAGIGAVTCGIAGGATLE